MRVDTGFKIERDIIVIIVIWAKMFNITITFLEKKFCQNSSGNIVVSVKKQQSWFYCWYDYVI